MLWRYGTTDEESIYVFSNHKSPYPPAPVRFACFLLQPFSSLSPFLLSASAENGLATRQSLQGCVASPYELLTTFMSHTYDESLKRATTQTLCISQEKSVQKMHV